MINFMAGARIAYDRVLLNNSSIGLQHQYWAHLKLDTGIHEDPSQIGRKLNRASFIDVHN